MDPTNNLAADYLDASTYRTIGIMDTGFKVVGYSSLVFFVLGLFTSKFIGIEIDSPENASIIPRIKF